MTTYMLNKCRIEDIVSKKSVLQLASVVFKVIFVFVKLNLIERQI